MCMSGQHQQSHRKGPTSLQTVCCLKTAQGWQGGGTLSVALLMLLRHARGRSAHLLLPSTPDCLSTHCDMPAPFHSSTVVSLAMNMNSWPWSSVVPIAMNS
jgi:hypothetical protein